MFAAIADAPRPPRESMRKEARRLNPAGFSVGKVADVTLLSKKLCASRRAVAGPQGSRRPAGESDFGTGCVDRGNGRKSKEDEQVGLIIAPSAGDGRWPRSSNWEFTRSSKRTRAAFQVRFCDHATRIMRTGYGFQIVAMSQTRLGRVLIKSVAASRPPDACFSPNSGAGADIAALRLRANNRSAGRFAGNLFPRVRLGTSNLNSFCQLL